MPDRDASRTSLLCYRCGNSLEALSLPLSRLDSCPSCSVDLHVCRMCRHYAPSAPDACTEDDAIEVRNKTAANFCDYFDPSVDVYDGREQRAEDAARTALENLFGDTPDPVAAEPSDDDVMKQAEDLFRK